MEMTGFKSFLFSDGEYEHLVYTKGEGKPVLIMHELPGLTSYTRNFAERLIDAGFQVYLPLLFGKLEEKGSVPKGYILCMTKEFGCLKAGTSAPVSDWLRALVRHLGASMGNAKIGVIGMCVTGAFAIPLILETNVGAAVASQPAVPFKFGYWITGKGDGPWMSQLNISDDDLLMAGQASTNQGTPLLIQRFADDRLCPHARVQRLQENFPNTGTLHEYDAPADGKNKHHALLTEEYDKANIPDANHPTRVALQRLVAFLHLHL
ncbi:dienelactone hydrolase family protein [Pseudomonas sp. ZB1P45]|uniref:dienelactone hydrolase family protein n=1 Tax=Pseudomonas frigoris TaxID=3398356 RepID=UPI0039EF9491